MTRRWTYEPRGTPQVPKPKHGWANDEPGFEEGVGGQIIGKCPAGISNTEAEQLLNEGISWTNPHSHHKEDWPEQIYVVHQGVIYRAIPTRGGISYHGFPAARRVPRSLKEKILRRARDLGCETEVKRWMRKHMGMKNL